MHISKVYTVDQVMRNNTRMHPGEPAVLIHLHNLNLHDEELFDDCDDEFAELDVIDEEEFVLRYCDDLDLFDDE
jgi:hypothetical protein